MLSTKEFYINLDKVILKDSDKIAVIQNYLDNCSAGSTYPKNWHYSAFVRKLVNKRQELNLSIEYVADHLGLNLPVYINFEEGKQRISAKLIVKLMDLLNVQVYELGGGKDPNAPLIAEMKAMGEKFSKLEVKNEELQGVVQKQNEEHTTFRTKQDNLNKEKDSQIEVLLTFKKEATTKYEGIIKDLKTENKKLKTKVKELEGKK